MDVAFEKITDNTLKNTIILSFSSFFLSSVSVQWHCHCVAVTSCIHCFARELFSPVYTGQKRGRGKENAIISYFKLIKFCEISTWICKNVSVVPVSPKMWVYYQLFFSAQCELCQNSPDIASLCQISAQSFEKRKLLCILLCERIDIGRRKTFCKSDFHLSINYNRMYYLKELQTALAVTA